MVGEAVSRITRMATLGSAHGIKASLLLRESARIALGSLLTAAWCA
jgi:hypothetical protein